MAYSPYLKVERSTGGAYSELLNIQDFTIGKGRQNVTDALRGGTGTITGRRPDLLPSIAIGDSVRVTVGVSALESVSTYYRVANYQVNYGILAAMDTWTLDLEDAIAYLGRATVDVSWAGGTNSWTAFEAVCTAAGVTANGSTGLSTVSAQTITQGNALQAAQTIANTEQAYITSDDASVSWSARGWPYLANSVTFTDSTAASPIVYDQLVFGSLADNYATKVIVLNQGGTDQTSGTGNFSYQLDSYSASTTDALNLAQFVGGNLSANTASPLQVSCTLKRQTNIDMFAMLNAPYLSYVTFRGTTYNTFILGWRISGDPDNIRATYYLASTSFFSYFILDSTTNGVLGTSKLGY